MWFVQYDLHRVAEKPNQRLVCGKATALSW
jgi:hypothetical protein